MIKQMKSTAHLDEGHLQCSCEYTNDNYFWQQINMSKDHETQHACDYCGTKYKVKQRDYDNSFYCLVEVGCQ